jgi:lipopolysaccharide transport system ATP-binding protein
VLEKGRIIFDGDVEEGINVYLNNSTADRNNYVDLTDKERPGNQNGHASLLSIEFPDTEDCVYQKGDKMRFKLRFRAENDLDSAFVRVIARYKGDSPVGLSRSRDLGTFKAGEETERSFLFDTSYLAEGTYYFNVALFQTDDVGTSVILDHVSRACSFEIVRGEDGKRKMSWEHRWWGSTEMPELTEAE